jgi:hypothetical protein
VIHCYALTGAPSAGPLPAGVDDAAVTQVACGRFHAVVSEHERAPRPTREGALAHAVVVAAAAEDVPTVPVRFGSHHRDVATLRDALADRAAGLAETMAHVGSRRELVIRSSARARAPREAARTSAPAGDGGAYLRERLTQEQQQRAAEGALRDELRRVSAPLDLLVVDVLERHGPEGPERCLLVPLHRLAETLDVARQCLADSPDIVLGGPWPPYSFVEDAV